MLQKLTDATWREYVDYAYELALRPDCTSYPVYYDGIKTKEEFVSRTEKAFFIEGEEILLYREEESPCGWIHYYYLREDNYLATVSMSFSAHMERGLEQFLAYVRDRYPGCEIWLGFPEENGRALSYLSEQGFRREEESYNDVYMLDSYTAGEDACGIVRVTEENFPLFARLHAQYDSDMYWNSERLLKNLERWMIFLYCEGQLPQGAICCTGDRMAEIFSVDFAGGVYRPDVFHILLKAVLNACKARQTEYLVFFNEQESQSDALAAGFHCVGRYVLTVGRSEE